MAVSVALAAPARPAAAQDILVAGDSILAWNRDSRQSIAWELARRTGREVVDVSVSGARFSAGPVSLVPDVRRQIGDARPEVLILGGGGNDLRGECGCSACDATLDLMVGPTLSGEFANLILPLTRAGTQVIYLAYYDIPVGGNAFSPCEEELDALEARMAALAAAVDGLHIVRGDRVIDRTNLSHYARDRLHPSPEGSARLGSLLAATVAEIAD